MAVQLLACDCKDCTHWEVVKMLVDDTIHLHCKTCGRTHEMDFFKIHEDPNSQMKWVPRNEE